MTEEYNALYCKAKEFFDKRKYSDCFECAKAALDQASDNYLKSEIFFLHARAKHEFAKENNEIDMYKEAISLYDESLKLAPSKYEANLKIGNIYQILSKIESKEKHLVCANERYKAAAIYSSDDFRIFYNYALSMYELAIMRESDVLLFEAIGLNKKAIALNPDCAEAHNNLGLSYYSLSRICEDEKLLFKALDEFRNAVTISPEYAGAHFNWCIALIGLAVINKQMSSALLDEALEKINEFERLSSDISSSNEIKQEIKCQKSKLKQQ